MGRYLSNLLRSGARPIGRRSGPPRRAPVIPELNVERVAAPPEPAPPPASQPVSAPAPLKHEPVAAEPEPPVRAAEPEPAETETPIVPAAAQPPWPSAERHDPEPERSEPRVPEPLPEVVVLTAPAPAANQAATAALPLDAVRSRPAPTGEAPKRSAPPRIPAPAQVETKPEKSVSAATERLMAHRDVRVPQWPAGGLAPRVEFITTERVVTLLPKPAAAEREHPAPRAEAAPAPKIEAPRETPALLTARPAAAPKTEAPRGGPALPAARPAAPKSEPRPVTPPPAPRPMARRESIAPAPAPFTPPSATPAVRHDPESGIHIRHLDIQIVNEEQRKPVRRPRPATPAAEPASRRFERDYIREVV